MALAPLPELFLRIARSEATYLSQRREGRKGGWHWGRKRCSIFPANTAEADWREGCAALGTWFAGGGFAGAFVLVLVRAKVTTPVEFPGLFEAFIKLETAEDGGPRKNEAKRLGFGREVVG